MGEMNLNEPSDSSGTVYIGRPGTRGVASGGGKPCLAVPVMGDTRSEITSAWTAAAEASPDLIEWRVDGITDPTLETLGLSLREYFRVPVLVTVRTKREGGRFPWRDSTQSEYSRLVWQASHWADAVDVEYEVPDFVDLVTRVKRNGAVAVASKHVLSGPFDGGLAREWLRSMNSSGADVAKLAWLVTTPSEVEEIREIQLWANENLPIPAAIMGMGEGSAGTRLGESARRNAFTFAHVGHPSAPGQASVAEVRASLE